jgi:hypothetical protein
MLQSESNKKESERDKPKYKAIPYFSSEKIGKNEFFDNID